MAKSKRARRNPVKFKNGKTYYPEKCNDAAAEKLMAERAFEKTHGVKMRKRVGSCTPKDAAIALRYGTDGSKFESTKERNARIRRARALARKRPKGAAACKRHEASLREQLAACGRKDASLRKALQKALKALQTANVKNGRKLPVKKAAKRVRARRNPVGSTATAAKPKYLVELETKRSLGMKLTPTQKKALAAHEKARKNPFTSKKGRKLRVHCTTKQSEKLLHTRGNDRKAHRRLTRVIVRGDGTVCTPQSASARIHLGKRRRKGAAKSSVKATKVERKPKSLIDKLLDFSPLGWAPNALTD